MSFINEDFLLRSDAARQLYHEYAADQPIFDYHCHIPPEDIAIDRQFDNIFEVWLEGDHYKWRAMRANGMAEEYCTGDASPHEKFRAWARTVPYTLRNPLYHWSHLELKRYFGIETLLDEKSADAIWEEANRQLTGGGLTVHGILRKFQVKVVCTTDDPTDSLEHHRTIADSDLETRVYPAFRPDRALGVDQPATFNAWTDALAAVSNIDCTTFALFLEALDSRHRFFHDMGGRLSDHGLEVAAADFCSESEAAAIYDRARTGQAASMDDHARFATFMMVFFGQLDAGRGWTKQLHLGPLRNQNTRMFEKIGGDTGFDSIGDARHVRPLGRYLDRLAREDALPKCILYSVNPADNYLLGTMIGNFQDGSVAGKMQLGSGWWYLDQKEGMEWQMNALSNTGLLSRFVGMLTDSRSFMSYPRHEYFRRVLCNLVGADMENGELPDDMELVGGMVRNIAYRNAREFFGMEPA